MKNLPALILILSNALFLTSADLVNVVPRVEVIRQENVVLPCATSFGDRHSVEWQFTPVGSAKTNDIFQNGYLNVQFKDKYRISSDKNKGEYNLTVMNAQLTDAGTYACIDEDGMGKKRRTFLIVYDSEPLGASNASLTQLSICGDVTDFIGLSCNVTYNGDETPELRWIQVLQSGTELEISDGTRNIITRDKAILRTVVRVSPQMDGAYFRCQTSLQKYNWTSSELQVQYALANRTRIDLDKKTSVACQVNANRNCSYDWFLKDGKTHLSDSETLDLSEMSPGNFVCKARCAIRSRNCSVDGTIVHYSETETSSLSIPGVLVAAIVLIIIPICVVGCIMRNRQRASDTNKETAPLLENNETLMPTPDIENLIVRGIAEMKNLIYVIFQDRPFIRVIKALDPFEKDRDIVLKQYLEDPWALRSCEKLNCLYIADRGKMSNCIWKFDLSTNGTEKIIPDLNPPHKFTVTSSGVIAVPKWPSHIDTVESDECGYSKSKRPSRIDIFESDQSGCLKSKIIELPKDMKEPYDAEPYDALLLSRSSVIVTHGHTKAYQQRVCLLEEDGKGPWTLKWSYPSKGTNEINNIDEIAMDDENILYVTDQNNQRVLLLNTRGQYLNSVKTRQLPYRTCYSKHYRRLLVGHYGAISIYKRLGTGKEVEMEYQKTVVCISYSSDKDVPKLKSLINPRTEWKMDIMNPISIGGNIVRGMAELNSKLYIVMQNHPTIRVFDCEDSFKELSSIETENAKSGNSLVDPWFIGACPINNSLYITDRSRKCILKVRIQDRHSEIFPIKSDLGDPFKLSVTSDGRILVPIWPSGLEIYSSDGHLDIPLPGDMMEPYHAIQVKKNTFIVSHGDKKSALHRVCKVKWSKENGSQIVWSYGNERGNQEHQLNRPRNIATDDKGRIYVTDEGNRRIIQLDENGNLLSKLENLQKKPERMFYSPSVNEIFVGGYGFIDRYFVDEHDQK